VVSSFHSIYIVVIWALVATFLDFICLFIIKGKDKNKTKKGMKCVPQDSNRRRFDACKQTWNPTTKQRQQFDEVENVNCI